MPRIPTLDDLGARPVPRSQRSIATVRNAGAVADAVGDFGGKVASIGQGMLEKQDKLAYAAAKTAILKADVQTRQELENETDYTKIEGLYTERMKAAREKAAALLPNKSDRSLFVVDTDMDLERGRAAISGIAREKRISARKATFSDGLDSLMDAGRDAPDEGTRAAIIGNANEMYDAGAKEGFLSAEEVAEGKRQWASNYITQQITGKLLAEDYDGAKSIFDKNVDKLDWRTAQGLQSDLKRMGDSRLAAQDAYGSAPGYVSADTPVTQPSVGKMLQAIESNESGGRQFGADGKPLTSSAGAVGIMQVMPGTGPEAAALAGLPWDEKRFRTDKDYNRALGVAYFNKQLETFGDPVVAAAAYNAGPGAVQKALKKGGNWLEALPQETQDYVANFQKKTGAMQSARRWDKESWYANIDKRAANEGWSFERTERAKAFADKQIARDEGLLARKRDAADEQASEVILGLREKFTDTSQIPRDVWGNMSPSARASAMNAAESNRKEAEPEANGPIMWQAHAIMYGDPQRFAKLDLSQYVGKVTRAEMDSLISEQAKLRSSGGAQTSIRGNISGALDFYTSLDPDLRKKLDKKDDPETYSRVFQDMESFVLAQTKGQRDPTDAELKAAFGRATMKVMVPGKLWGMNEARRFEVELGKTYQVEVPQAVRQRIIASYQRNNGGANPPDGIVGATYVKFKGVPGYWN